MTYEELKKTDFYIALFYILNNDDHEFKKKVATKKDSGSITGCLVFSAIFVICTVLLVDFVIEHGIKLNLMLGKYANCQSQ